MSEQANITIEVVCKCGWYVKSSDKEVVKEACQKHDAKCPELFEPDQEKK